ncbi:DUF3606 domain-containing protein [Phenylobacterium sp.]|uniref:DUF3606 domain-containing protein n=1 Tax=Phenylobacterium sp. TaxID=1871053 RepID=UPI002F426DC5
MIRRELLVNQLATSANADENRKAALDRAGDGAQRKGTLLNSPIAKFGRPRRDRICLEAHRDVMFWAGLWGLSDQELHDAVAAVGPMAADVAAYLGVPLQGEDLCRVPRQN